MTPILVTIGLSVLGFLATIVTGTAIEVFHTYVVRFIDKKIQEYKNNRHQNG